MAGSTIAPFAVTISEFSISEGNNEVIALSIPSGIYIMGMSQIRYFISFSWSGINEAEAQVYATFYIVDSNGDVVASVTSAETRTGKSGSATLTGAFPSTGDSAFVPVVVGTYTVSARISGKYSPGFGSTTYVSDTTREIPDVSFLEYTKPTISSFEIYRATSAGVKSDEGTYLRYSVSASIKKLLSTDTGTFVLRYRQTGIGVWTNVTVGAGVDSLNVVGAQVSGTFPLSASYDVELVITDRYASVTGAKTIPTGTAVLHLKADKSGIGIGKYAEASNLLDISLPTKFSAGVAIGKGVDSGAILDVNYPARFRQAVTMDSPLPLSQGGTGGTTATSALNSLGIRFGTIGFTCKSANYVDVSVTFLPAFPATPLVVILTPEATFTSANSVNGWSIISKSATGFTFRFYHEASNTPTVNMFWIAIQ